MPMASSRKVLITMKPRPPSVIRMNITACPKGAQYSGVLTTVCPVTVTAEMEVKKATSTGVNSPETEAKGNMSRIAPKLMNSVNPITRMPETPSIRRGRRGDSSRRMVCETSRRRGNRMMASMGRLPRLAAKLKGSRWRRPNRPARELSRLEYTAVRRTLRHFALHKAGF